MTGLPFIFFIKEYYGKYGKLLQHNLLPFYLFIKEYDDGEEFSIFKNKGKERAKGKKNGERGENLTFSEDDDYEEEI